ncbi:reverse transcriptase domain-containing protein [Tanacetum coccineum]
MPVYFVSRALQGPEINCTSMEKVVLALVHASKRLKKYFQAHPIVIITDQPIKQVLLKWSIELGEYDIQYRPSTFDATNNEAEYEALIAGLRITKQMGVKNLQTNVDSRLVVNQPFYKWGNDISGPFLKGPGKVKFLIVAIDYFTKWIEAKPVATIMGNQIKKSVRDNIVCRFGLPGEVISDNGKQFRDNPFKDWC